MKKLVKRPLKMIAVAAFMVALGYGISTNSEFSESGKTSNVNLSALSSVSAQGENETPYHECSGGTEECVRVGMGNKVYIFYKP